jgi:hypothetical protein
MLGISLNVETQNMWANRVHFSFEVFDDMYLTFFWMYRLKSTLSEVPNL